MSKKELSIASKNEAENKRRIQKFLESIAKEGAETQFLRLKKYSKGRCGNSVSAFRINYYYLNLFHQYL